MVFIYVEISVIGAENKEKPIFPPLFSMGLSWLFVAFPSIDYSTLSHSPL